MEERIETICAEQLRNQARQIEAEMIQNRRAIHRNPEVGGILPETTAFVMEKLREYGYEPEELCESGVVAVISGDKPGNVMMLRADMDALPIAEETDLEFKSENGCMHACGHDIHTAMLLGAAKLLRENRDKIHGTVKLVFQPDEEGFGGAKKMLEAGVLNNPKVDAAMALHVSTGTKTGMIQCSKGVTLAGCIPFKVRVTGVGAHGAMPETGVDPINIAAHIYLSLQEILAREIASDENIVMTIGKFRAGERPNIIPGEAVMEGTIRSTNRELGDYAFRRIGEIASATAAAFRGSAEVTAESSVPPLENDADLMDEMAGYICELHGEEYVYDPGKPVMASEDFASYTYEVPCAYMTIGAGSKEESPLYGRPMHNSKIIFNEEMMGYGASALAYCALKWLENHEA